MEGAVVTASVGPTAGDLYLASVEAWLAHLDEPHDPAVECCTTCEALMGRVKVARNVWRNSRHQAVSVRVEG